MPVEHLEQLAVAQADDDDERRERPAVQRGVEPLGGLRAGIDWRIGPVETVVETGRARDAGGGMRAIHERGA